MHSFLRAPFDAGFSRPTTINTPALRQPINLEVAINFIYIGKYSLHGRRGVGGLLIEFRVKY